MIVMTIASTASVNALRRSGTMTMLRFRWWLRRLVRSSRCAEADRQPVPAVDGDHRHRELHELTLAEVPSRRCVLGVRHARLAYLRDRVRPCECRALEGRKERRLAPHRRRVQPLLG